LGEGCRRTGWYLHAWVLMGNHYHLLLATPEANLVNGRQWLPGTYTQRYNARPRKRGHLFVLLQMLAWWLCERTRVSRRWVAERLQMGHESSVGKALGPRSLFRTGLHPNSLGRAIL
jgi:REP element-mobilizing transposase RayT